MLSREEMVMESADTTRSSTPRILKNSAALVFTVQIFITGACTSTFFPRLPVMVTVLVSTSSLSPSPPNTMTDAPAIATIATHAMAINVLELAIHVHSNTHI